MDNRQLKIVVPKGGNEETPIINCIGFCLEEKRSEPQNRGGDPKLCMAISLEWEFRESVAAEC